MGMLGGQSHTPFMPMGGMQGIPMMGYQQAAPDASIQMRRQRPRLGNREEIRQHMNMMIQAAMQEGHRQAIAGASAAVEPGTYEDTERTRRGEAAPAPRALRDSAPTTGAAASSVPIAVPLQGVGPVGSQPNTQYSMSHQDPQGTAHTRMPAPPSFAGGMTARQRAELSASARTISPWRS